MVCLGQAGVGDDEAPVVEDEVRDEVVAPRGHRVAELGRLLGQLREGLGETVADLDLTAPEGAHQLVLVVAGDGDGVPGGRHPHGQPQDARGVRATVDEVTQEGHGAALRVDGVDGPAGAVPDEVVAEASQQRLELGAAAVHVADDVERPMVIAAVVVEPFAADRDRGDLVDSGEHVHPAKPLSLQAFQ